MSNSRVVIVGNPIDGLGFVGPFDSFDEAHNWAIGIDEYWITRMEPPHERP